MSPEKLELLRDLIRAEIVLSLQIVMVMICLFMPRKMLIRYFLKFVKDFVELTESK